MTAAEAGRAGGLDDAELIAAHLVDERRRRRRPSTLQHRAANLARLAGGLPTGLFEASAEDLEAWRDDLEARLAPASLKTYIAHARSFYGWLARSGRRCDNPAADLMMPVVRRGRARPIGEDDLALALRCAGEPVRTMLILAAFLGLRCCEIAGLRGGCLDEGPGGWTIDVVGKGGKPRTLPCPQEVVEVLRPHLRGVGRGVVFRMPTTGKPVTAEWVSSALNGFLHGLGIASTAHTLRHRYGSQVYERSRDLRLVQELLGHESPVTTAVYVAASASRAAGVTAELADGLPAAGRGARAPLTALRRV